MSAPGTIVALAMALCAFAAQAHVVYGTKTLHGLVAEADLVLHARITSTGEPIGVTTEAGSASRPSVEAEVLAVLKGSFTEPRVRFAQHGHGVASFEPGGEALVFLLDVARSRELSALGRAGTLAWVSVQEHEDAYPLEAPTRERLLGVVRRYVSADAAGSPEVRDAALRSATLDLLTSGDPDLAASAVRELVLAPEAALLTAEELPALVPVLGDASTSMGVRAALLAELERRKLVDAPPHWLRLLQATAPTRDRVTAIRAARASAAPSVRTRLIALLADPEVEVAAAAASALGMPGNAAAVAPLAASLDHDAEKVRMAAIRGLGRIAGAGADRALEAAADAHPDPATRRRAGAELAKRRARQSR